MAPMADRRRNADDHSFVRHVHVVDHRLLAWVAAALPVALNRPNRMLLWSTLVVSIRGVSSGEHLIRRLCRTHSLPALSAADLPR